MKHYFFLLSILFFLIGCNQSTTEKDPEKKDSTVAKKVFVEEKYTHADYPNPQQLDYWAIDIIKRTKPVEDSLRIINDEGIIVKAQEYFDEEFFQRDSSNNKGLYDLDNDGRPELIAVFYSGGSHCCDGVWIGRQIVPGFYEHAFTLSGGYTKLDEQNRFLFAPYENLAYFYSCYMCDGEMNPPYDYLACLILVQYRYGFPVMCSPNEIKKKKIITNLSLLSKIAVPSINKKSGQDSLAFRKNFAKNIISYYFNSYGDTINCKELFYKYYKGIDKDTIYSEISSNFDIGFVLDDPYYSTRMKKASDFFMKK